MNIEELTDYEAEEGARFDLYLKRIERGEVEEYPNPERFRKLSQPVGKRAVGVPIWPQIPLFGSLVVHLSPVKREDFAKVHLFEPEDLPALMELCKQTGRVQFTLAARPTMFAGLDYLDPVLEELSPPVVRALPNSAFFTETSLRKTAIEFDTLARVTFWPWLKSILRNSGYDSAFAAQNYDTLRSVYSMLKLLGYQKTAEEIADSLVDDWLRAHRLLYLYDIIVHGPTLDTMKEVYCFSRQFMKGMKDIPGPRPPASTNQFPYEIGASFQESPVLSPESLEATKAVMDRYAEVPRMVGALDDAVAGCKPEQVASANEELRTALRTLWEDSGKKGNAINGVSHGFGVGMAVGGSCAGQVLAGATGLLSGLGFPLTNKSLEPSSGKVVQGATRLLSRSFTLSVFNPDKKYRFGKDRARAGQKPASSSATAGNIDAPQLPSGGLE